MPSVSAGSTSVPQSYVHLVPTSVIFGNRAFADIIKLI